MSIFIPKKDEILGGLKNVLFWDKKCFSTFFGWNFAWSGNFCPDSFYCRWVTLDNCLKIVYNNMNRTVLTLNLCEDPWGAGNVVRAKEGLALLFDYEERRIYAKSKKRK